MYNNLKVLGHGGESIVYKYNNQALKVFNNSKSEKISIVLSNINLKHFITPNDILYKDSKYIGYTMNLIDNYEPANNINKNCLIDNLNSIKKDIIILSQNNIMIRDLIPKNSLLKNNKLYFFDTSLFEINEHVININQINIKRLYVYLEYLLKESTGSLEGRKYISKLFSNNIIDFIIDKMNEQETIKEFSKRIIQVDKVKK